MVLPACSPGPACLLGPACYAVLPFPGQALGLRPFLNLLTNVLGRIILTSYSDASEMEVNPIAVDRELLKGSTVTLVLSVLSRAPSHGYQMVKEMERLSRGVLTLKEGTLYPILHGLEANGLIRAEWETGGGGRERKVYRITDQGRGELERRSREWEEFRSAVDAVVQGGVLLYAGI